MPASHVTRRTLMRLLPLGALPMAGAQAAKSEPAECGLPVNAVDSLYHYQLLLDQVTIDLSQDIGRETGKQLQSCQDLAASLRDKLKQLQDYLHSNDKWPGLRDRFASIETSLKQMKGTTPGGVNAEAVEKQLPSTLQSLQALMDNVTATCQIDPGGKTAQLIAEIFQSLDQTNQGVASLNEAHSAWADKYQKVNEYKERCSVSLTSASDWIADAGRTSRTWARDASRELASAQADLRQMIAFGTASPNDGKPSAAPTLQLLLAATQNTLGVTAALKPASYRGGWDQTAPPAAATGVARDNPALVQNVRDLVNNRKYFKPGCLTQVVNAIAVCWPVWITYSTGSPADAQQGKNLIASFVSFDLIWGTVSDARHELSEALWNAYANRMA